MCTGALGIRLYMLSYDKKSVLTVQNDWKGYIK